MQQKKGLLGEIARHWLPRPIARWARQWSRWQAQTSEQQLSLGQLSDILTWFASDTDTAIVLTDRKAIIQWVNPAFMQLTGFDESELIGQRVGRAQLGPESSLDTLESIRKAILRGQGFNVQIIHYNKAGAAYWVDIESRPIRNPAGEVRHFIITYRDVTAQREQTEQLKLAKQSAEQLASDLTSSRQQLRMAADAGGLSLWDWDLANDRFWMCSCMIPVANEQWVESCGLWDLFTLAHEDDFPRIETTINRLLSPNPPQIDEQFRILVAGKWRWVNFRGAVSERDPTGKPIRVSGTLVDETHRKEAEEQAQADRDLLQCVIGHIPHAVFWKSADQRYLGCNRKFAESLGLTSETQVVGRTDAELRSNVQEAEAIAEIDQRIVMTGEQLIAQQTTIVDAKGSKRTLVTSKVPLRHANGTVFGMLGMFNDITDQKSLERRLADARQLESLGRLAAGVAHEINTPMQYISDNVEFLSESTAQVFELIDRVQQQLETLQQSNSPTTSEKNGPALKSNADVNVRFDAADRKLKFIREQVPRAIKDCLIGSRRVMEIVTAMKVFTHPGTNGYAQANVNDLILSTTSITRNRWKYCAKLQLDLAPDLQPIRCLAGEINQVILNLIINAADAVTEKFGTTDEIEGLITIRTRKVANGISLEVTDNGCGIPEENQSRIFDPFFTTKEVGKGTGQGLTLCYGVVCNKHGGTLTLDSQVGLGTTFRVFLPDIPCPVSKAAEPLSPTQDCLS